MREAPSFAAQEGEILRRVVPSGKKSCRIGDAEEAEDSPEKRKITRLGKKNEMREEL